MKLHFMGIGGSGIYGVAKLAQKMGYGVTGCDLEKNTAYAKHIFQGHDPAHLKDVGLVIVSPAVFYQNADHPEIVEARRRGIMMTWQEFLGRHLQKGKKVICVAGTHGKSTTTAMAGKLLADAGLDPLVVLGANVNEWKGSSRFGRGKYFITEADEFYDNFLNYHPEIIILNNVEFDHPDYFKSESEVFESFRKFIGNLTGQKTLIVNKNSIGIKKLLEGINLKEINLVEVEPEPKLNLKLMGAHNIANAAMVSALGKLLGIDEALIKKSLEGFSGIGRRMELISVKGGVKIYDDYAHHPTAIAATLQGLREKFPKSRIWAINEPHGFARTHALLSKYKGVFKDADKVIIGPIFKARDKETFGITPEKVAKALDHKDAIGVNSFNQIKEIVAKEVKSGDIILVMGAGKSYLWARKLSGN
jgi:UDP-N-acetylmuramate--alanine ligase